MSSWRRPPSRCAFGPTPAWTRPSSGSSPWRSASSACAPPTVPQRSGRWRSASGSGSSGGTRVLTHQGADQVLRGPDAVLQPGAGSGGGRAHRPAGDNGSGKTTLLKILLGEEEPDAGKVRIGPTVKVGYLPQHVHFDHPERNLVDTLIYEQDCTAQTARNRLAAFKVPGGRTCSSPCPPCPAGSRAACGCACSWTRRSTS